MWEPISLSALTKLIISDEFCMTGSCDKFWEHIKINPEKWQLPPYGDEGGGFWVVAVVGQTCIYYDDIEGEFCTRSYKTYGIISDDYYGGRGDLLSQVTYLYNQVIQPS